MSDSGVHALSGAYAVDAVDDLERARFERHLAECAECRQEVDGLREAAAMLAASASLVPTPGLRDRVLGEIQSVRPLPPAPARIGAPARRRRWLPALVAAAVLTVAGAGAIWQPWRDDPVAVQPSAVERVLQAPDAQRVSLDFPDGATATLVRSKAEGRAVLQTTDMPPAPSGKVYEVWLQSPAGEMLPAGLMPPAPDQAVLLDGDAATAVAAGITVEPAGGSDQPTSAPIALFELGEES